MPTQLDAEVEEDIPVLMVTGVNLQRGGRGPQALQAGGGAGRVCEPCSLWMAVCSRALPPSLLCFSFLAFSLPICPHV